MDIGKGSGPADNGVDMEISDGLFWLTLPDGRHIGLREDDIVRALSGQAIRGSKYTLRAGLVRLAD
jgi:hypothetical protein